MTTMMMKGCDHVTNRCFRKLSVSDLPLVLQLEKDYRSNFICIENAKLFLSNSSNWIFACIEDERIIGFAYGYELNRLNDAGNMLYIHEIGVQPEFQGQGIGKQIFNGIKSLCKVQGICKIFLVTEKSNVAACSLYESVGGKSDRSDDILYYFDDFG
jgi:ribosomal protein S18 acetylase RimI-like enzyme